MKGGCFLLAILVASVSFCQGNLSSQVESLGDTVQVHALLKQSKALQWIDSYGSLSYADQALTLARNIDYPEGVAVANTLRGFCFWSFGDNDLAIEAALEALDYGQAEKDIFIEAESYYILARGYMDLNERSKANEYIDQAEKLALHGNNGEQLSSIYNLKGVIKFIENQQDSALYYYNKAYESGRRMVWHPFSFRASFQTSVSVMLRKIQRWLPPISIRRCHSPRKLIIKLRKHPLRQSLGMPTCEITT